MEVNYEKNLKKFASILVAFALSLQLIPLLNLTATAVNEPIVTEIINEQGERVVTIVEDGKENVITFSTDGKIYLNDNEVVIEKEYENSVAEVPTPYATWVHDFSPNPLGGTPRQYTESLGITNYNIYTGGSYLKDVPPGTLSVLLSSDMLCVPVTVSVAIDLFRYAAENITNSAREYAPTSTWASVKSYQFLNPTLSYSLTKYYRYANTYYYQKDCVGYAGESEYYEIETYN